MSCRDPPPQNSMAIHSLSRLERNSIILCNIKCTEMDLWDVPLMYVVCSGQIGQSETLQCHDNYGTYVHTGSDFITVHRKWVHYCKQEVSPYHTYILYSVSIHDPISSPLLEELTSNNFQSSPLCWDACIQKEYRFPVGLC